MALQFRAGGRSSAFSESMSTRLAHLWEELLGTAFMDDVMGLEATGGVDKD